MACVMLCSGCGCSSNLPLSFNASLDNVSQELVYNVEYVKNWEGDYAKSSNIPDSLLTIQSKGTYTVEFDEWNLPDKSELFPQGSQENQPIGSDIVKGYDGAIYRLITTLKIDPVYIVNGEQVLAPEYDNPCDDTSEKVRYDYIKTVTYFLPENQSFAPIFVDQYISYSTIAYADGNIVIGRYRGNHHTTYNVNTYTMKTTWYDFTTNQPTVNTNTFKYDYRTLVDNSQFLFALRYASIKKDSPAKLPVVSFNFGEAKTLNISNVSSLSYDVTDEGGLTINNTLQTGKINLNKLQYSLAENTATGVAQLVYYQNASEGDISNYNLMYRYVEPLSDFSSYLSLGALVYTLKSATIN